MWKKIAIATLALSALAAWPEESQAQTVISQNGFYPRVIARGNEREMIKAIPIQYRPYRPMHFYGNTVRRQYFRTGLISSNPFRPIANRRTRSQEGQEELVIDEG